MEATFGPARCALGRVEAEAGFLILEREHVVVAWLDGLTAAWTRVPPRHQQVIPLWVRLVIQSRRDAGAVREVAGDAKLAGYLRIEERELEAGVAKLARGAFPNR